MIPMRYPVVITILLLVTIQGFPLVSAQQEKPRRVFTNEDVKRTAPSQPATPTPEETATVAEPPQTSATLSEAPPATGESTGPLAGLRMDLKQAQELQRTLDQYLNLYPAKAAEETDPNRKSQLDALTTALMNLVQQNSRHISDLEQRLAEQQDQTSTQQ